jgi:hypothetical protein|tara:strand:+ start:517 stop:819 length:303 start_codon:yes stop_codon:yes gene_type:complete
MITIIEAISALNPGTKVSVTAEDFEQITWHDGNPTNITKDQIVTKQAELKTAYDTTEYQRKRKEEYPPIEDQLDMIFWDKKNGTTEWEDSVQVIKDKYPK